MPATARRQQQEPSGPTLRDLARLCRVRRLFADRFEVTTDTGHRYTVACAMVGGDFAARCCCPVRVYRKQECRHELAVVMFERARVAEAQGFYR